MRIAFKVGVVHVGALHPKTLTAWRIANEASRRHLGYPLTITAIHDGQHSGRSRHYLDTADPYRPATFDMRTWRSQWNGALGQARLAVRDACADEIRERLETTYHGEWDVVRESTHIHIEYDPRFDEQGVA